MGFNHHDETQLMEWAGDASESLARIAGVATRIDKRLKKLNKILKSLDEETDVEIDFAKAEPVLIPMIYYPLEGKIVHFRAEEALIGLKAEDNTDLIYFYIAAV